MTTQQVTQLPASRCDIIGSLSDSLAKGTPSEFINQKASYCKLIRKWQQRIQVQWNVTITATLNWAQETGPTIFTK